MIIHRTLRVNGDVVPFEWHPDVVGNGGMIRAPGLGVFHAASFGEGHVALRALYLERSGGVT
jgi:hypothetical protein